MAKRAKFCYDISKFYLISSGEPRRRRGLNKDNGIFKKKIKI